MASLAIKNLKRDLRFPTELETLFTRIDRVDDLHLLLANKDFFVKDRLAKCEQRLGAANTDQLIKEHFIAAGPGEIITKKPFALKNSFQKWGIIVKGPVAFEKNVTIGRSVITGPAYISEESKIFDSHLRGTPTGAVYLGKSCNVWDYSEINRSLIGDSSMIHTCNINDSILGPNSSFGATHTMPIHRKYKKANLFSQNQTKLKQRIVIANYSFGNKIKILDPTANKVVQTETNHFGTLSGTNVSCASGTIIYPGTIIGAGAKLLSTIPITGYVEPDQMYSYYFVIRLSEDGRRMLQPKGTLAQLMKNHFTNSRT